jgi:hypothetical protein
MLDATNSSRPDSSELMHQFVYSTVSDQGKKSRVQSPSLNLSDRVLW